MAAVCVTFGNIEGASASEQQRWSPSHRMLFWFHLAELAEIVMARCGCLSMLTEASKKTRIAMIHVAESPISMANAWNAIFRKLEGKSTNSNTFPT